MTGHVIITADEPVYADGEWATPICDSMMENDFVHRDENGHYRINWEIKYY